MDQQAPPGWYQQGLHQRYWDGTSWTDHYAPSPPAADGAVTSDERSLALIAYLLGFLVSFLGPLIIFLIKKDESPFIRRHCAEILNHMITMAVIAIVSVVVLVLGIILAATVVALGVIIAIIAGLALAAVSIASLVWSIMGAIAANRGEDYRYPIAMRLIS